MQAKTDTVNLLVIEEQEIYQKCTIIYCLSTRVLKYCVFLVPAKRARCTRRNGIITQVMLLSVKSSIKT